MKRPAPSKKLDIKTLTIATLTRSDLRQAAGGLPKDDHTHSVCITQCCDTDQFTNCESRPGICW